MTSLPLPIYILRWDSSASPTAQSHVYRIFFRPPPPLPTLPIQSSPRISPSINTTEHGLVSISPAKLPLIVYYHGSGFVVSSAASTICHNFYCHIVHQTPALMVSVDYRLAPEHRLPAAYDDALEALHWIKTADEEWLTKYADFSRCFLMRSSAGGNIAYHVVLRAVAAVDQLMPLKIKGLILQQPYFGGVGRTPSEIRLANDKVFPLRMNDLAFELALPIGADRDHEYSNPTRAVRLAVLDQVKKQGWRFLVTGSRGDPLVDRQIALAKMLREKGVDVREMFSDGGCHGAEIFDQSMAELFYGVLKDFVFTC